MFVGTFEHSLDDKGRLVLPSAFREPVAVGGYLTQYDGCLAVWTPESFDEFVARLSEKVRASEAAPNAMRVFTATASHVKPDSQGRISIPPRLRELADLTQDVVLTGNLRHIELWNPQRWLQVSDEGGESLTEAVSTLGIY